MRTVVRRTKVREELLEIVGLFRRERSRMRKTETGEMKCFPANNDYNNNRKRNKIKQKRRPDVRKRITIRFPLLGV